MGLHPLPVAGPRGMGADEGEDMGEKQGKRTSQGATQGGCAALPGPPPCPSPTQGWRAPHKQGHSTEDAAMGEDAVERRHHGGNT